MTATYTPGSGTDRDRVRALIPDKDLTGLTPVLGVYTLTTYTYLDAELDDFFSTEGNVKRAAAVALESMASGLLMTGGLIENVAGKSDNSRTLATLMARAKDLREQADLDDASEEGGAFDIAEQVEDAFSARERLWKQRLRGSV